MKRYIFIAEELWIQPIAVEAEDFDTAVGLVDEGQGEYLDGPDYYETLRITLKRVEDV